MISPHQGNLARVRIQSLVTSPASNAAYVTSRLDMGKFFNLASYRSRMLRNDCHGKPRCLDEAAYDTSSQAARAGGATRQWTGARFFE